MWNVAFEMLALFDVECEQNAEIDGCIVLGGGTCGPWDMVWRVECRVKPN